jgi:hypothetical protein
MTRSGCKCKCKRHESLPDVSVWCLFTQMSCTIRIMHIFQKGLPVHPSAQRRSASTHVRVKRGKEAHLEDFNEGVPRIQTRFV